MNDAVARILVVDDDAHIVALLKAMFAGYKNFSSIVVGVESVEQAVVQLKKESFDLAICDFQMPEHDGLELMAWIRANRPQLPVVLSSGFADLCAASLLHLGISALMPKPFESTTLLKKVRKVLTPLTKKWGAYEGPHVRRVEVFCSPSPMVCDIKLADIIGRGGMLVAVKRQAVMRGDVIGFLLKRHPGAEEVLLEGIGTVAWVEPSSGGDLDPNHHTMICGLEFEYLEETSRAAVQQIIALNRPVAFIPAAIDEGSSQQRPQPQPQQSAGNFNHESGTF